MVRTLRFHCRGHRVDPWWGTKIPQAAWPGKKRGWGRIYYIFGVVLLREDRNMGRKEGKDQIKIQRSEPYFRNAWGNF